MAKRDLNRSIKIFIDNSDAMTNVESLEKKMGELRAELARLNAQGQKDTSAHKATERELRQLERSYGNYQNKVRETERVLNNLSGATYKELQTVRSQLINSLKNTERGTEEYTEKLNVLNEVQKEFNEARKEMNVSLRSNDIESAIKRTGSIATFMGNMYMKAAQFALRALNDVKLFINESVVLAGQAEGIEHAFDRIANRDYLKSLREQTKGLVSDFTLMQSAVRAENFDIPLNQLGKLLEFAQNRARDTGENIDYLVESIINGIGRKSPLILDNLGISTVRLQEEVKKTGDFATAVGNIIDEEMAKSGEAIDAATDKTQRKEVAWQNLQLTVGKFFVGFNKGWNTMSANFANGLNKILTGSENAIKAYDDQIKKVSDLEVSTANLANRYDELSNKASLNETEQSELDKVMNQLIAVIPEAAQLTGEYGDELSVNTEKVREYIAAERARIEIMKESALEQARKDLEAAQRARDIAKAQIEQGGKTIAIGGGGVVATTSYVVDTSTLGEAIEDFNIAGNELKKAQDRIDNLTGVSYERQTAARYQFNQMNQTQLKEWIEDEKNAKDEFLSIAKEIHNSRVDLNEDPNETNKTVEKSKTKYQLELDALTEYIANEKALIQQKYTEGKISQEEYNRELEYLEMERLRKSLEISGLTFVQQQEIELKLFDMKKTMLQKIEHEERTHQAKLLEIRQAADKARADSNYNALKKIAQDNKDSWLQQKQQELDKVKEYADMAVDLSDQLGGILGQYIAGNEEQQKDAQRNMIFLALDTLEMVVKLAVAEATAKAFASGDPISGAIKTAAITAAITLAFSTAKSFVRTKLGQKSSGSDEAGATPTGARVPQLAGGKYDVIGADDGRTYRGVPYKGLVQTGFVSTPTLMGEQGKELVISHPDLVRLQRHINYPLILNAINDARTGRVPQRSGGNYSQVQQSNIVNNGLDPAVLNRLSEAIEKLTNEGVYAPVVLSEIQRQEYIQNTSRKIGSK